ncbi:hypothetical protein MRB53_028387 [Persea americana]|uniref:Uncharacterized protein n=1 Tax=Persea americana TaxID=3435 RepID=A0ACC2KG17_PERAE|nr:hypothetical protein MRB53_028387 [Persea americana]
MNRHKPPFGKRSRSQYDSRENNGKRRRNISTFDATPKANDTVYRILCPGSKIGGVIGKGGNIINALRDETHAKIRIVDGIPGADERVVIISSQSTGISGQNTNEDPRNDGPNEKEHELMHPLCPAQDALLKVHDRIVVEEDQDGNLIYEPNEHDDVVTARLLVPSVQVGCLLGKGGTIIQQLRNDTGATIRIMPAEHLPADAIGTDELVQISGTLTVAKKALYEVSTLLHQNPRKESIPPNGGTHGFHASGAPLQPRNPVWSHQNSGGFNAMHGRNTGELAEFSMKMLCSAEKTGGVIGKGGANVRQLQQETGASILVDSIVPDSDERVITVSAKEAPWDPRSPTIQAILQLQGKACEISDNGIVITRLLVPSSKIGCILGEGGRVITEMRRRTQADIRVYSKSDRPNCASPDEELVQISGNMNVAKGALMEISSRLRDRILRPANAAAHPGPIGHFQGFPTPANFSVRGPRPSGMIGSGSSVSYDHLKAGGEAQGYPVRSTPMGYSNLNSSVGLKIPNSAISSVFGMGGSNISNSHQISGARVKLQDPLSGAPECVVEIHGSSEQTNAAQSLLQAFIASGEAQQRPYPLH